VDKLLHRSPQNARRGACGFLKDKFRLECVEGAYSAFWSV
jgi:hypothetical protein